MADISIGTAKLKKALIGPSSSVPQPRLHPSCIKIGHLRVWCPRALNIGTGFPLDSRFQGERDAAPAIT
jgi:hypothetical protein